MFSQPNDTQSCSLPILLYLHSICFTCWSLMELKHYWLPHHLFLTNNHHLSLIFNQHWKTYYVPILQGWKSDKIFFSSFQLLLCITRIFSHYFDFSGQFSLLHTSYFCQLMKLLVSIIFACAAMFKVAAI